MNSQKLNDMLGPTFSDLGLPPLPLTLVDTHGMPMNVSGEVWTFNDVVMRSDFDFRQLGGKNVWLEYALKRYVIRQLRRVGPRECHNTIRLNTRYMASASSWANLCSATSLSQHAHALRAVLSETLENLRRDQTLYNFARIRAWYSWCADYLQDIGFDPDYAHELELLRIPGNEKGVAVRIDDPEVGPLNDAEQILLRHALQDDESKEFEHVQERVALWLALSFGLNPANFIEIREEDLSPLVPDGDIGEGGMALRLPRIKKRARPRQFHKVEYVTERLAQELKSLIQLNQMTRPDLGEGFGRPLLFRSEQREDSRGPMREWAWHLRSAEFTQMIRRCVKRYGLISPRTGDPMRISTRRLRYTFATNRVREGISAIDLAEALDHSDLQHVRVYFDAKSSVVERLDRAGAMTIAPILNLFKGTVRRTVDEAVNGANPAKRIRPAPDIAGPMVAFRHLGVCGKGEICKFYPPYSCCVCDRYQPFTDSLDLHEQMLDHLLDRREAMRVDPLGMDRIAVQLDEVVYGCAQVIELIRSHDADKKQ